MLMLLNLARNPIAIAALGAVAAFGSYHVGKVNGYYEGRAAQKDAQAAADARASEEIRERIKDALEEIGTDTSDSNVDSILRQLAGGAADGD